MYSFFFFNDTATTEIYTLSLHDALPISDGAMLGVLVRAVAPERSLQAIGDDAAVPDVEQPGELQLAIAQRRPHASRPPRVRVGDDSRFGIPQGKAVGGDVERALRRPGTRRGEAGDE